MDYIKKALTSVAVFGLMASILPGTEAAFLKDAFANRFAIGAAIPGAEISDRELALLNSHFTTVTPENCMKPIVLHPQEDVFNYGPADALVAMALNNGLSVNGHTLVWHSRCPNWFFQDASGPADRELVLRRMRNHIESVVRHFAGKAQSWDVVNEAIDDGKEYLRKSVWLNSLGDDFIAEAFIAARKADSGVKLYYNDYNIERPEKREKTLRLIRDLKLRNAPIDGIGIQGHWQLDKIPFKDIETAIVEFHNEGMRVMITELDIDVVPRKTSGADVAVRELGSDDPFLVGLAPEMLKRQADQYADLFALFLRHQDKIDRVTFWGLHDGRSWLNSHPRKRTNHPLLWDRNLEPKLALAEILAISSK